MEQLLSRVQDLDAAKLHTRSSNTNLQQVSGIVNAIDPASGRNALHTACLLGSDDCAQSLLQAGALVHLRDNLGHTAYVQLFKVLKSGWLTSHDLTACTMLLGVDTVRVSNCFGMQALTWVATI